MKAKDLKKGNKVKIFFEGDFFNATVVRVNKKTIQAMWENKAKKSAHSRLIYLFNVIKRIK